MQLRLPLVPRSFGHAPEVPRLRAPSPPAVVPVDKHRHVVTVGETKYDVEIARHRRARRYVLRMTPGGSLRLTVPRGASIDGGLAFARKQTVWIEREHARLRQRSAPIGDGGSVWWRGEPVTLVRDEASIRFAHEIIALESDPGHPQPHVDPASERALVLSHLLAVAKRELPARCLELAAQHGVTVARVSVRNQRSRWGSCSSEAAIALNWRLVQMPPSVSDYIILHELMHTRQPNHSRRFWREVDSVCPWWRDAERWIRLHGRQIL